jgi:hypothetical protein
MDQQEPVNLPSCAPSLSSSQTISDWEEVSSSSGAMQLVEMDKSSLPRLHISSLYVFHS